MLQHLKAQMCPGAPRCTVRREERWDTLLSSPTSPGTYPERIGLTPWNKAESPIFVAFSKFLYFNKVTLKSGRYQKKKKKSLSIFEMKGTIGNAKNKKIKYINFLRYEINTGFFAKLLHHSAHRMDGASYFIFPF